MGSQQPAMGPLRLVDLRNVLDATVDNAVAGLNELAASLPRQKRPGKVRRSDADALTEQPLHTPSRVPRSSPAAAADPARVSSSSAMCAAIPCRGSLACN